MDEAISSSGGGRGGEGRVHRSRDLLQGFGAGEESSADRDLVKVEGGVEGLSEVELSLGLSLGGCFGVDRPKDKRLVRSSSISIFPAVQELFPAVSPLARTCSLPTETEEELRKRKQLQSLKRLEAKRKRLEKKLNSSSSNPGPKDSIRDESMGEDIDGGLRSAVDGIFASSSKAFGIRSHKNDGSKGFPLVSQSSIGSQGSLSSIALDVQNQIKQGFNISGSSNDNEDKNHSATSLSTEQSNLNGQVKASSASREEDGRLTAHTAGAERSMMEAMPCVSARGDGPNGRRIEGFLYNYRKGEDVRIVCLCHGSFFTPAEFVKHAGGGDVTHPLKHIVVNPSPSPFS